MTTPSSSPPAQKARESLVARLTRFKKLISELSWSSQQEVDDLTEAISALTAPVAESEVAGGETTEVVNDMTTAELKAELALKTKWLANEREAMLHHRKRAEELGKDKFGLGRLLTAVKHELKECQKTCTRHDLDLSNLLTQTGSALDAKDAELAEMRQLNQVLSADLQDAQAQLAALPRTRDVGRTGEGELVERLKRVAALLAERGHHEHRTGFIGYGDDTLAHAKAVSDAIRALAGTAKQEGKAE